MNKQPSKYNSQDGMCCNDCVQLIANGEFPPNSTEQRDSELDLATRGWTLGDSERDIEESHWPCELCRERSFGPRHHVVKLILKKQEVQV